MFKKSFTTLDKILFIKQLTALLQAGLPILQSLTSLEKCQTHPSFKLVLFAIKRDLNQGKNLSESLAQHPTFFDELTCKLVEVGEATGQLEKLLQESIRYHERRVAFKNRLIKALFYPSILFILGMLMAFFMLVFIVPRFAILFPATLYTLPLLTKILFRLSTLCQSLLFLLFLPLFFYVCFLLIKHYLPYLPGITPIRKKIQLARFTRSLALGVSAGIPIMDALKLASNTIKDICFHHMIFSINNKMSAGWQLYQSMALFTYFPPLMIQLIKTGEESDNLAEMLNNVAYFLEKEIERQLDHVTQLLEPLIMLLLGALIGGLVIGMYLPVFNLGSTL